MSDTSERKNALELVTGEIDRISPENILSDEFGVCILDKKFHNFTTLSTITLDHENTVTPEDAISYIDNGKIYYHITNTANSLYFDDRTEESWNKEESSLLKGKERKVITLIIEVIAESRLSITITRASIKVKENMTYRQANNSHLFNEESEIYRIAQVLEKIGEISPSPLLEAIRGRYSDGKIINSQQIPTILSTLVNYICSWVLFLKEIPYIPAPNSLEDTCDNENEWVKGRFTGPLRRKDARENLKQLSNLLSPED